jgi:hypothetical protein
LPAAPPSRVGIGEEILAADDTVIDIVPVVHAGRVTDKEEDMASVRGKWRAMNARRAEPGDNGAGAGVDVCVDGKRVVVITRKVELTFPASAHVVGLAVVHAGRVTDKEEDMASVGGKWRAMNARRAEPGDNGAGVGAGVGVGVEGCVDGKRVVITRKVELTFPASARVVGLGASDGIALVA